MKTKSSFILMAVIGSVVFAGFGWGLYQFFTGDKEMNAVEWAEYKENARDLAIVCGENLIRGTTDAKVISKESVKIFIKATTTGGEAWIADSEEITEYGEKPKALQITTVHVVNGKESNPAVVSTVEGKKVHCTHAGI